MVGLVAVCLMLISGAGSYWDKPIQLYSGDLGFHIQNMTCNDATSRCVTCYTVHSMGRTYLHTFEYTEDPFKFQFFASAGGREFNIRFVQEGPFETLRLCDEIDDLLDWDYLTEVRSVVCMDNDFSRLPPQAACANPVAVLSLEYHFSDQKISGEQIMYCMPLQDQP